MAMYLFLLYSSFLNLGLYITAKKLGIIDWMQLKVDELLWPSRCEFCFFFRLAFFEMVGILMSTNDVVLVLLKSFLAGIISATASWYLYSTAIK